MDNLHILYTMICYHGSTKMRLDQFLSNNISNISRTRIAKYIKSGAVMVDTQIILEPSYIIQRGAEVSISIAKDPTPVLAPCNGALDVVFEDEHVLVINKPAGLTVHPGAGNHQDTLVNILLDLYGGSLSDVGGAERPGIVHRLDKDTSGLMVIAKTNRAHYHLAEQIASRVVKRLYKALVFKTPTPWVGTIHTRYGRSKRDPTKMCVLYSGGKEAITSYRVLDSFADGALSLVECSLHTGRTHQIRVHMTHIGHPIVGDKTYGSGLNHNLSALDCNQQSLIRSFPRQALHAYSLNFIHPVTQEELFFTKEMPAELVLLFPAQSS